MKPRVGVLVLAAASVLAQNITPPVTIRTTTTLVQVGVSAHDSKGRPITDLKKEDFELLDNGKQREIALFSGEAAPRPAETAQPRAAGTIADPLLVSSKAGSAVILLDWTNSSFRNTARAREQARAMMERLGPGERIGLDSFDRSGLKVLNELGADHDSILQSLKTAIGNPYPCFQPPMDGLGEADTMKNCGGPKIKEFWVARRIDDTLLAFESIAARLNGVPGRKALIWVSSAFPLDWNSSAAVDRAMLRLENAGVALYPVDARALTMDGMTDRDNNTWGTMDEFAQRTGGVVFKGRNNLDDGIQAAIEDVDTGYTLGFYAPSDTPRDDFHKLTLRSLRPGVSLRYKEAYTIGPPPEPPPAIPGAEARSAALAALLAAESKAGQPGEPAQAAPGVASPPPAVVPPSVPAVTLRTTTTLVQLSVVAHDSKGAPVKDLTRDDFKILDNGHEQEIAQFTPEAAASAAPVPLRRVDQDDTQPPPANKPFGNAIILIDYLNSGWGPSSRARPEITRFLKDYDPDGKIALWQLDEDGLKRLSDFGSDRDAIQKALDTSSGKPGVCSDSDFAGPVCEPGEARYFLILRELRTYEALDALSNQLSPLAGRKALIWVSTSTNVQDALAKRGDSTVLPQVEAEKARVLHKLNWADVALYPVDACGLGANPWPCNHHIEAEDDFAAETGGVATHGLNRLDISMHNAVNDVQFVYAMAFYPTDAASKSEFHKLKVEVKRPGVKLEYKQGYSIDPPVSPPLPEVPGAQSRSAALAALLAPEMKTAQPAEAAPPSAPGVAPPPPATVIPPPLPANTPEITTRETQLTFRSRVNLVTVPVVVRDSKKTAVDNLEKDDFQLLDGGKPQIVSRFSVEKAAQPTAAPASAAPQGAPNSRPPAAPLSMPQRYVALVIDDLHTEFGDLVWARQAAQRFLAANGNNGERFAVYTTSGQNNLDFTADRDALNKTLLAIMPRERSSGNECPQITYFEADQILNKNNEELLRIMGAELQACRNQAYTSDEKNYIVNEGARRVLMEGDWNTRQTLNTLRAVVGKLATMPGRRSLVQISDGFFLLDEHRPDEMSLMESAIHANVVIDSLDAAGLRAYVPGGDASQRGAITPELQLAKIRYDQAGDEAAAAALDETARGTGGRYFHNSNDMDEGIKLLAGAPEAIYLLGFAPQNLKLDGRYHALKVTLRNPKGFTIEARPGYYAPNHAADPAEQSKEEIQAAFFSTEDIREIPAAMEAQFFKSGPDEATVDILARVDVKQLNFKQQDGRNRNVVTVVSGLFDENGNYVSGIQKVLEMRLKDETLATRLATGMVVRSSIKTKPGRYLVRVVVRDAEGQELTALSTALEIP